MEMVTEDYDEIENLSDEQKDKIKRLIRELPRLIQENKTMKLLHNDLKDECDTEGTIMTPQHLLMEYPLNEQNDIVRHWHKTDGFHVLWLGELQNYPTEIANAQMALTLARWLGSKSEWEKDVEEMHSKNIFYWKRWLCPPFRYDRDFFKLALVTHYPTQLKRIRLSIS